MLELAYMERNGMKIDRLRLTWIGLTVLLLIAFVGCKKHEDTSQVDAIKSRGKDPPTLVLGLLPDRKAIDVISENNILGLYLEEVLNKEIKLIVSSSYSEMIKAGTEGKIDIGYFGPVSYTLAKAKYDIEPFASPIRSGLTTYRSIIIVNNKNNISTLEELKESRVAFGDRASTSSRLYPQLMLSLAGLEYKKDYEVIYYGSHDNVALAVQSGKADAGGIGSYNFSKMIQEGSIDPLKIKVLAKSPPIPRDPWTMRANLSPELKEKIRIAFITLDNKDILKTFGAEGFAEVSDKDYNGIRKAIEILQLKPEELIKAMPSKRLI